MVVIGGSGTGKSVLLKCILGLLEPGRAAPSKVDGEERGRPAWRSDLDRVRSKFGMLFQNAALFDSLKRLGERRLRPDPGQGHVQGARLAKHYRHGEARRRSGLGDDVAELGMPAALSGGMRKRVGLARAIATEPEIIFFDEPTTGLDPIMGDVIDHLIVKCVKELGATALSITHDMASARRISDRIAMLYGGRYYLGKVRQGTSIRSGNDSCRSVHLAAAA